MGQAAAGSVIPDTAICFTRHHFGLSLFKGQGSLPLELYNETFSRTSRLIFHVTIVIR
jgi:hypothetical protein